MKNFIDTAIFSFLTLFPILNPPAMAPIFYELTSHLDEKRQKKIALMVAKYSFYLLSISLLIGSWILSIFGISVSIIKIAGGMLLFNTAWKMLNEQPRISEKEKKEIIKIDENTAFYPMTLPLTAGAGSISITISLTPENLSFSLKSFFEIIAVITGILLSSISIYLFYKYSTIIKKLDYVAQQIIAKLSAFILLAIAIKMTIDGIKIILQ